jgi:hypothetical protein
MNALKQILPSGQVSDDVYILAGPYALSNASRTLADLRRFLKVTKGVRGALSFFTDKQCTNPLTEENYDALRESLVGHDLFFTVQAEEA